MAGQAGMTVEDLRKHLYTSHIEMTCPLCGRPQTHLVGCKGCGGDAWGYECEMVHGEGFKDQLRQHLRLALIQAEGTTPEQGEHAVRHAYALGGCMVCADCWRDTSLEWEAYATCPLYLVSEVVLGWLGSDRPRVFQSLLLRLLEAEARSDRDLQQGVINQWVADVWTRWVVGAHRQWLSGKYAEQVGIHTGGQAWSVVPENRVDESVLAWRALLVGAATKQDAVEGGA